jgi:hypothetical protein
MPNEEAQKNQEAKPVKVPIALSAERIVMRDDKKNDVSEKIAARQTIRERLIANHTADLERIDKEIADLQIVSDGLDQLQ